MKHKFQIVQIARDNSAYILILESSYQVYMPYGNVGLRPRKRKYPFC